jgi:hypothetical protein
MKSISIAIALVLLTAFGCSKFGSGIQGSGTIKSVTKEVSGFTKLDVSGAWQIDITQGTPAKLEITADDNLHAIISAKVENQVLKLSTTKNYSASTELTAKITTPKLEGLDLSGAVDVVARNVDSQKFDLVLTGAADVSIQGKTDKLNIDATGAAKVAAKSLRAKDVKVDSAGSSTIKVFAGNSISLDVTGASDVSYAGHPKVVKQDVSGASTVKSE